MNDNRVVAGVDLGSSHVKCLIGELDHAAPIRVLGGAIVPCRGLAGGVVVDVMIAADAIRQAIETAEDSAKRQVREILLGMQGRHIRSCNMRGAMTLARTDKSITREDVESVIRNGRPAIQPADREILHFLPTFSLDGVGGVVDPIGLEASRLDVETHVITASVNPVLHATRAVEKAGFQVADPVYSLLATAEAVLTADEKELGCALIDLGGQSVALGVYAEGQLRFSKELATGADAISSDIASALTTSLAEGERIKREYGLAHPDLVEESQSIQFRGADGRVPRTVDAKNVMKIIAPRVKDIFTRIREELLETSFGESGPRAFVLAGGGASMRGIVWAAAEILDARGRLGAPVPDRFAGDERWLTPALAAALGLLALPAKSGYGAINASRSSPPEWTRRLSALMDQLF